MVIVRGQDIPGTMRMAAVVVEEIRRDANILQDAGAFDWEAQWRRKVSKYEIDYNPENWASLHIGGEQIFTSREDNDAISQVEALAAGEDVTDSIVSEAAGNILGALEDLAVEHDSQTAFVFTPLSARCDPGAPGSQDRFLRGLGLSSVATAPRASIGVHRLLRRHGRNPHA